MSQVKKEIVDLLSKCIDAVEKKGADEEIVSSLMKAAEVCDKLNMTREGKNLKVKAAEHMVESAERLFKIGKYYDALHYYSMATQTYMEVELKEKSRETIGFVEKCSDELFNKQSYYDALKSYYEAVETYSKLGLQKEASRLISHIREQGEKLSKQNDSMSTIYYLRAAEVCDKLNMTREGKNLKVKAAEHMVESAERLFKIGKYYDALQTLWQLLDQESRQ